jgi:hypothetical protein
MYLNPASLPTIAIALVCACPGREILLGKSLRLKHGWVAVVNRGQADINKKMTMNEARGKELEFFKSVDQYRCVACQRAEVVHVWSLFVCR